MKYKVSVVVPIYGTEKYIERCAKSLFEQTLDDIEYIFVNDCTKDHAIEKLEEVIKNYPERKDQIRIINLERNRGLAIARGTGFKQCKGEYIITCDSDDWVELDAYESMYRLAKDKNADIVICDFYKNDGVNKTVFPITHPTERLSLIKDMLYDKTKWCIWNKMFRANLLNKDITFPRLSMGEDCAFVLQLAYYCNKIAYTNKVSYNYFYNPSSLVNNPSEESRYKRFKEGMDNCQIVDSFYKDKEEYAELKGGLGYMLFQTKKLLLPTIQNDKFKAIWKKTCPGLEWKIFRDKRTPIKERFRSLLILSKIYPQITNKLGLTKCI